MRYIIVLFSTRTWKRARDAKARPGSAMQIGEMPTSSPDGGPAEALAAAPVAPREPAGCPQRCRRSASPCGGLRRVLVPSRLP